MRRRIRETRQIAEPSGQRLTRTTSCVVRIRRAGGWACLDLWTDSCSHRRKSASRSRKAPDGLSRCRFLRGRCALGAEASPLRERSLPPGDYQYFTRFSNTGACGSSCLGLILINFWAWGRLGAGGGLGGWPARLFGARGLPFSTRPGCAELLNRERISQPKEATIPSKILSGLDFQLAYLILQTRRGIKPLSRW